MVNYLSKLAFKDNYFMKIYYNGAIVNVPLTKEEYNSLTLQTLDRLNESDFVASCYNKGNDVILRLDLARKGE